MHSGFTIAGIVLGALTGFIAPLSSRLEGVGIAVELMTGISALFAAQASGSSWAACIGGLIIGHGVGAFIRMFTKS